MSTIEEKIKVMQAYKDGKLIEYKDNSLHIRSSIGWQINKDPLWNWSAHEYRVKRECREFYVALGVSFGAAAMIYRDFFKTKTDVQSFLQQHGYDANYDIIKVREVLEDDN